MATRLVSLALLAGLLTGCRHGALTVRQQELCCPTDVRQKHCWCWGEDAIFDKPCAVDEAYHGHKPTCWREWDAPATVWRDEFCGPTSCRPGVVRESVTVINQAPSGHVVTDPTPTMQPLPADVMAPPADRSSIEVAPVEPSPVESAPAESLLPPAAVEPAAPPEAPRADPFGALPALPAANQASRSPERAQPKVATLPSDADLRDGPLPDAPALAMPTTSEPLGTPAPAKEFELRIVEEAAYTPTPRRTPRRPYGFDFVK